MKTILILLFFTFSSYAHYSKPQLLARYSGADTFNAPAGLACFSSEPHASVDGVFLGCTTESGFVMMRWNPEAEVVAKTRTGMFSRPVEIMGKTNWYEFNEGGVQNLYEFQHQKLQVSELKNLGPVFSLIDSFIAIKNNTYIYRLQDEEKRIQLWSKNGVTSLYAEDVAHIFPPVSSIEGSFVVKVRHQHLNESAPDELLLWNNGLKAILKDRDADSTSNVTSFRHQYTLDGDKVAVVVTDDQGEVLLIIDGEKRIEVARAGKEVLSFDYFSPKMRNGVLVFRGMDHQKRKAVWVYEDKKLKRLLTQGDVVHTDKGPARVDYKSQDALFYGAPGIGPNGEIYLQATLTDIDSPMTLLGIGLIRFSKE